MPVRDQRQRHARHHSASIHRLISMDTRVSGMEMPSELGE
jgi:hypothetical protein